jgi:hypothetical protein
MCSTPTTDHRPPTTDHRQPEGERGRGGEGERGRTGNLESLISNLRPPTNLTRCGALCADA